jgi:hypothetical protein
VNIAQVLAPGVRPRDNFLFTFSNDLDHNRFNLLVSLVASAEMVVLAGAVFLSRPRRRQMPEAWWTLLAWAAAAMLLMFPVTFLAWADLPELRFVQLPWRWLLCLNVAFALWMTMAWRRWLPRLAVCFVMLAVLALAWHRIQPPWWDTSADIAEMQDNIQEGLGYEGTDEYVPAGADAYEIRHDARRVTLEGRGRAQIHVLQWGPTSKFFTADMSEPGKLVLRLFDYPAWRVEVNHRAIATETAETTGQIIAPVQAGENQVQITFMRTRDRTVGGIISLATFLLLVCAMAFKRFKAIPNHRGHREPT